MNPKLLFLAFMQGYLDNSTLAFKKRPVLEDYEALLRRGVPAFKSYLQENYDGPIEDYDFLLWSQDFLRLKGV